MKRKSWTIPTEEQEQIKLAAWLTKQNIRFYAIPNGGSRHPLEAFKLKRMGVQSGVPDICVPVPNDFYFGLYLELKRKKGGKLSEKQIEWLEFLKGQGYYADCVCGFDEAYKTILKYFEKTQ